MKTTKVKYITEDEWYGKIFTCKKCDKEFIWEDFKYCPMCGLEIDWTDIERI